MRVTLRVSGRHDQESLDLGADQLVLVGRSPDAGALGLGAARLARLRCVALQSPNVSANHLLLERSDSRLLVRDLSSRNGTWARVPTESEVWLAGDDVALSLGSPHAGSLVDDAPEAASWTDADDFPAGVSLAIQAWLSRRDTPARIRVVSSRADAEPESFGRVPLATGNHLLTEPLRTMNDDWLDVMARIERYVSTQNATFSAEEGLRQDGLVVASPVMRATIARVVQAAGSGASNLLLLGPSGAGKEGLARCFHRHSRRAGPFVARNCAMFNRELIRSELFGAERGAFTGSTARIVGAVERAHEGTLFLDEIGELPSDLQPTLLRFLDRGEYEPIGLYGQAKFADVSLVCATNRDLRASALNGDFRLDLWFRLSVHVVQVPPLSQRFEDVIRYLESRTLEPGRSLFDAFDDDSLALLRGHSWDGNFRELINFAVRASMAARSGRLSVSRCEGLLAEGAITPPRRPSRTPRAVEPGEPEWSGIWDRAVAAFAEDHGTQMPQSWDDVKDYIESYLKPLMFAHLAGTERLSSRAELDLKTVSARVDADRGTALKQVQRYLDRFGK